MTNIMERGHYYKNFEISPKLLTSQPIINRHKSYAQWQHWQAVNTLCSQEIAHVIKTISENF